MYQTLKTLNIPEEAIIELWGVFKSTVLAKTPSVAESIENKTDDTEWDLTRTYYPNHACLWNKPFNINKPCRIMIKNSFIALVHFEGENSTEENVLERIYRLEDLSLHRILM